MQRSQHAMSILIRLVDDLLDVSRVRTGKLDMRREACDLGRLVEDAVQAQRQVHATRTMTCTLPPARAVPVLADPMRIGQVVTNYLTNALKYSAEDQPVDVRVTVARGQARVSVRDQGPGLPAGQRRHVWDAFYRAEGIPDLTGSGIGLGLGLHICKTIVERHGGRVGVTSVVGRGSTFWFTLPLAAGSGEQ